MFLIKFTPHYRRVEIKSETEYVLTEPIVEHAKSLRRDQAADHFKVTCQTNVKVREKKDPPVVHVCFSVFAPGFVFRFLNK